SRIRLDRVRAGVQGGGPRGSRGRLHRGLVRGERGSDGGGGGRWRLRRRDHRWHRRGPSAAGDADPAQPPPAGGRDPAHDFRDLLVPGGSGHRVAGRRRLDPRLARPLCGDGRDLHHHRATPRAGFQPGGLIVERIWTWPIAFFRFWYHFLIGDDCTVAAAVAVGLILTALLNGAHVTAWWLVPLIVIFMLGLRLRRASKA